ETNLASTVGRGCSVKKVSDAPSRPRICIPDSTAHPSVRLSKGNYETSDEEESKKGGSNGESDKKEYNSKETGSEGIALLNCTMDNTIDESEKRSDEGKSPDSHDEEKPPRELKNNNDKDTIGTLDEYSITPAELVDETTEATYDEVLINEEGTDNPTDKPRELTYDKTPLTQERNEGSTRRYATTRRRGRRSNEDIRPEPQREVVPVGDHVNKVERTATENFEAKKGQGLPYDEFMAAQNDMKQDASNKTSEYMLQHTFRKVKKNKFGNPYTTTTTFNPTSPKVQLAPTDC
ncbi:16350_t:CDS:2, partial [Acaulospora morrowiae]